MKQKCLKVIVGIYASKTSDVKCKQVGIWKAN